MSGINKWTLQIEGIKKSSSFSLEQFSFKKIAMYAYTITFIVLLIYNLIFVFVYYYNTDEFYKKLIHTIISYSLSVIICLIFFIYFPRKQITYSGMGAVPMLVITVIEVEFNIYAYDYDQITALYFLLLFSLMTLLFFYTLNNFTFEENFILIIIFNSLIAFYIGLRILLGNIIYICTIVYHTFGISSCLIGSVSFCIQGYISIRNRAALILAKRNGKKTLKKWKRTLDMCQDGVAIISSDCNIYKNNAMTSIFKAAGKMDDDVCKNVRVTFIIA